MTAREHTILVFKCEDQEFRKSVLREGTFGKKPYEHSVCQIKLEDCESIDVAKYTSKAITIGESCNEFERNLDVCLMSMYEGEMSDFIITTIYGEGRTETMSFKVSLVKLEFKGVIFNWSAKQKYELALRHKEQGVELFKSDRVKDSAYRFTKGLKVILSIPLDVERPPVEVDGISATDIKALKAKLYNNMASCYFANQLWTSVIEFCNKVFTYEPNNIKALYKIGVGYRYDKNFEKAEEAFHKLLQLEPQHKAAIEQLHIVQSVLKQENIRVNNMVKKMFGDMSTGK